MFAVSKNCGRSFSFLYFKPLIVTSLLKVQTSRDSEKRKRASSLITVYGNKHCYGIDPSSRASKEAEPSQLSVVVARFDCKSFSKQNLSSLA